MPYILLKRSDIPAGVLQNLDLRPNTSQRKFPYETFGQTGYRIQPPHDPVVLANAGGVITFAAQAEGLVAWFLTNVNDGTGAAAVGTATIAAVAAGDTLTIGTVPAFTLAAVNAARTPGGMDFSDSAFAGSDILAASSLVAAIMDDANWATIGVTRPVSADNGGGTLAVVTITALADGTAYNYLLTENTGGTTIVVAGMAGGLDADALTAAEALQDATDVLGLLNYGVPAAPAGALTLAAINGALTTGTITAGQVTNILDILAGRQYLVPAGVQIEAASAFGVVPAIGAVGGPGWDVTEGFRRIYTTGALHISMGDGRLELMASNAFTYLGVAGAAVAVYNDDGTLFTAL